MGKQKFDYNKIREKDYINFKAEKVLKVGEFLYI